MGAVLEQPGLERAYEQHAGALRAKMEAKIGAGAVTAAMEDGRARDLEAVVDDLVALLETELRNPA